MHPYPNRISPWRRWGRLVWVGALLHAVAIALPALAGQGHRQLVHLYFADALQPFLVGEARVVVDPGDVSAFGRQLVAELIAGPTRGHRATIPAGTQLRSLFIVDGGTAVVDFSRQMRENHPGGVRMEQLTVFSVVNSLILNLDGVERVQMLIDGAVAETLGGHLALEFPFTADMLLTR